MDSRLFWYEAETSGDGDIVNSGPVNLPDVGDGGDIRRALCRHAMQASCAVGDGSGSELTITYTDGRDVIRYMVSVDHVHKGEGNDQFTFRIAT